MALNFAKPKAFPHVYDTETGASADFYEISIDMATELRLVAGPLVKALTALFAQHSADQTHRHRTARKGEDFENEEMVLAIDPALAAERYKQRQGAIGDLVVALTTKDNIRLICKVIMDSLRDEYPRGKITPAMVDQFMQDVPLPQITSLLFGVAKANAGLFGPLASLVPTSLKDMKALVARPGTASKEQEETDKAPADEAPADAAA